MPGCAGRALKSSSKALSPPAEAPTAAIGNAAVFFCIQSLKTTPADKYIANDHIKQCVSGVRIADPAAAGCGETKFFM